MAPSGGLTAKYKAHALPPYDINTNWFYLLSFFLKLTKKASNFTWIVPNTLKLLYLLENSLCS